MLVPPVRCAYIFALALDGSCSAFRRGGCRSTSVGLAPEKASTARGECPDGSSIVAMMRFDHSLLLSQGAPMSRLRNLCSDRRLRVPHPITRLSVVALGFALASVLIAVGCAETPDDVFVRATNGDAEAQVVLGDRFFEPGEARDLTAAADWYERAATQGNQLAQFKLGQLHFGESDGAFDPSPRLGFAGSAMRLRWGTKRRCAT